MVLKNDAAFQEFLNELSICTDISKFREGELIERVSLFACDGCGKGKECHDGNYSCWNCSACIIKDNKNCINRSQCEDCEDCWCPLCDKQKYKYDTTCDGDSPYEERMYYINRELARVIRGLPFEMETWTPLIYSEKIKWWLSENLYYKLNPSKRPQPVTLPLGDLYNVSRIMAGLGGMKYDS